MQKVMKLLQNFDATPQEMFNVLNSYGYVGQIQAKKAACLMAYRHINRLKKILFQGIARELLPAKENYLFLGPTGCGKTYLVELLFQKIDRKSVV